MCSTNFLSAQIDPNFAPNIESYWFVKHITDSMVQIWWPYIWATISYETISAAQISSMVHNLENLYEVLPVYVATTAT